MPTCWRGFLTYSPSVAFQIELSEEYGLKFKSRSTQTKHCQQGSPNDQRLSYPYNRTCARACLPRHIPSRKAKPLRGSCWKTIR